MITIISSLLNSLNSPFSSWSLLSAIPRSCRANFNLFIYISIAQSPSRPFRSNRNTLSLPLAMAETNSRNPVRRSSSSRYLKPSNRHSMSGVISHKIILVISRFQDTNTISFSLNQMHCLIILIKRVQFNQLYIESIVVKILLYYTMCFLSIVFYILGVDF